ncbi:50S ribosomal protein L21 [Halanaerobiaceae bacterium Z-7014]|uniref:Large ribosomal subunit protein bL21 n=1 Tax=Halonatronomonas betaini TaxID=2778430 RepID=A0A931F9I3_9FIRM|nr:50S ribosomal protein L21 [Halonatronomonas betaini]MBF8435972.1 50S ribosomal protein L21 [Halonatronomonas betaini]
MYAIIKTGGKQYRVNEGDILKVEKLTTPEGEKLDIDQVLAISNDEGLNVGQPYLENAKVEATVLEHGKNKKVTVFKYKPKSRQRTKTGHRQPFTRIRIDSING